MKKYICLNRVECSWADEKPPREFTLPPDEENVCPNCEKNNIQEVKNNIRAPWKIPLMLLVGLIVIGLTVKYWPRTVSVDDVSDEHVPVSQTLSVGTVTVGNPNNQGAGGGPNGPRNTTAVNSVPIHTTVTWTRVVGSEFCEDIPRCIQGYSERNNLGEIRQRRIQNCDECGPAKK